MAQNEPNKPDNIINVATAKTQAEEKPATGQSVPEAPSPEMTVEEKAALAHEGEAAL